MGEISGETLRITWENRGPAVLVCPVGEIDLTASPVFRGFMAK